MEHKGKFYCGTAGWQIPKELTPTAVQGTHLERYAQVFTAAEINSTFYRPHLPRTFERWARSVPAHFRFSVKMHKSITHAQRLSDIRPAQVFLEMVSALGSKLGPVLIQLPPSLSWSAQGEDFLLALREAYSGEVVLEARHPSWSSGDARKALKGTRISGVAADPPLITEGIMPIGYTALTYYRLHGAPRMYWSSYSDIFLDRMATEITECLYRGLTVWTIFDNTAAGSAVPNALRLQQRVHELLA